MRKLHFYQPRQSNSINQVRLSFLFFSSKRRKRKKTNYNKKKTGNKDDLYLGSLLTFGPKSKSSG